MSITLHRVDKRWTRRQPWVLREIDLVLPAGSITVLTGTNGSGKSTLLHVAAGLTPPTRGRISRRGKRVAVVPDRFQPPARMSALAYLTQLGRIRGLDQRQALRRAGELLDRLRVAPDAETPVENLSRGNAQKVLLAQAFLRPVDLLVLDEPETGLEAHARAELDELIGHARAHGAAVLMSDPAYSGSEALEIANGRLRRATPRPCSVSIELVATQDTCDLARVVWAFDGCVVRRVAPDRVRVTLDPTDADRFVSTAVRQGWSVRYLESKEPAQ